MCNLKIANCNIKLMQSPGCLKEDYLAFSRAFCVVVVGFFFCPCVLFSELPVREEEGWQVSTICLAFISTTDYFS